MQLQSLYLILLLVSLSLLLAQISVKQKQAKHLLFATFCGSVAMMMSQKIGSDSLGAYQYLLGIGSCATCNCYWLFSRALFRETSPFSRKHIVFAAAIAVLIVGNQGFQFINQQFAVHSFAINASHLALLNLLQMLSSCVLVLTFWEACRGFSHASSKQKWQRIIFIASFGGAVMLCKALNGDENALSQVQQEWLVSGVTLWILLVSQTLIVWCDKAHANQREATVVAQSDSSAILSAPQMNPSTAAETNEITEADIALSQAVKQIVFDDKLFLQPNLKVADIARALNVSEYRVSRVLRNQLQASNFNQFINQLRVEHAQTLLSDPDTKHWPVLVIGMESGFASVGPFTRAFKTITGTTPNQYRTESCCH